MGQRYDQLSLEERCRVAGFRAEGRTIRQIAADLDRSPSTIARELKRNSGKQSATPRHERPTRARRGAGAGPRLERERAACVRRCCKRSLRGWSPEQTCAALERRHGRRVIGVESIYRFVHAQIARHKDYNWRYYLPRGKSKRGRRGRRGGSPALLMTGRIPICERPAQAAERATPGHWEADLMLFSKYGQAVLAVHERSSRLLLATMPKGKAAGPIADLIAQLLGPLPQPLRRTITFGNGTEFARHLDLQRTLALQDLLLRPPFAVAERRRRKCHRPHAPHSSAQDRPRRRLEKPARPHCSSPTTTHPENALTGSPQPRLLCLSVVLRTRIRLHPLTLAHQRRMVNS